MGLFGPVILGRRGLRINEHGCYAEILQVGVLTAGKATVASPVTTSETVRARKQSR